MISEVQSWRQAKRDRSEGMFWITDFAGKGRRERSKITKMEMDQRKVRRISRWIAILCAFILAMAMGITVWATAEPGTTIYIVDGKEGVNIRSQASTDSDAVGKLNGGAALTVISVVSAGGHNWYQVECVINGETKTGYIREDLVKIPESGAPAEAEDPAGEGEGGETAPEGGTPAPEGGGGFSSASKLFSELQFMNSGTEPEVLPAGFLSVNIESNGVQFPAWADEDQEFFIFYAAKSTGETDWYMLDKANGECIRYRDFMVGTTTVSSNGDGVSKTAFIIVVVFCVALVAATTVMGIKLMNGGGRDDYDDDDDYDDEEDEGPRVRKSSVFRKFSDEEDDYEEEEDEEDDYDDGYDGRRRSSGRPAYQGAVQPGTRPARPVGETRQPAQSRPAGGSRPAGQQGGMVRPAGQQSARPAGQQPVRPAGQQPVRPAGQQPGRPSGGAAQGQQRYAQRQAGQQRYVQRTNAPRRDDDGEY